MLRGRGRKFRGRKFRISVVGRRKQLMALHSSVSASACTRYDQRTVPTSWWVVPGAIPEYRGPSTEYMHLLKSSDSNNLPAKQRSDTDIRTPYTYPDSEDVSQHRRLAAAPCNASSALTDLTVVGTGFDSAPPTALATAANTVPTTGRKNSQTVVPTEGIIAQSSDVPKPKQLSPAPPPSHNRSCATEPTRRRSVDCLSSQFTALTCEHAPPPGPHPPVGYQARHALRTIDPGEAQAVQCRRRRCPELNRCVSGNLMHPSSRSKHLHTRKSRPFAPSASRLGVS
ncbi:hypothetical protein RJ55_06230 [Drechmeria coniospora]|nr:hypothetical protein RJ55_06230 [Drechmeria coniospora]